MKLKDFTGIFKIVFFVFLILYSVIFSILIFDSIDFSQIPISILFYNLGRLGGLIGFLFLSVLIFSGETARFFDRLFGMDQIIKFQRKFATITFIIVITHPLFFILSDISYLNYLVPDFVSIPLSLGTIGFYIFIIVSISSKLYKRISYNIWQYLHITTYLLFFFILYHASKLGSDFDNILVKPLFYTILFIIIIGIVYRTNYKLKQRKNKYEVKEIKWETSNVFTLKLKSNQKFNFKPGQFCFLRINKDKLYARHPFTISNSPNDETLDFTMKITGRFTKIASQLEVGEEVIVEGPFGIFTVNDDKKDLVFIAGGVGITPFMSLIKENIEKNSPKRITLFYGSRTKKDIIFNNFFKDVKKPWLKVVHVLSGDSDPNYEKGYIDAELIQKYVKNIENSKFYICGPEKMKDNLIRDLRHVRISKKNIYIESFFW